MYYPNTTYRIQFNKDFTLNDLARIIPYLHDLGIKTIYASPIFEAVPGSTHGYDVTNPLRINPEIGTLEQLKEISNGLKSLGMGWLQDIVPNHMAFHHQNEWLMDVLEKGQASEYARFFDIDWQHPSFTGKLMVPFLDNPLSEVIKAGRLRLAAWQSKLYLNFEGNLFPLNRETPLSITGNSSESLADGVTRINADTATLQVIAENQYYTLCYWRDTERIINYRRFFTINGLIGLRMEDEAVFAHYHQLIKQLIDDGIIQGLRVDHIDGLYEPAKYLNRLRRLAGDDVYIVVEKILQADEPLPANWPIQGSTGYDYLGVVNNVFTHSENKKAFTGFYERWTHNTRKPHLQLTDKKADILYKYMGGELNNLARLFIDSRLADDGTLMQLSDEDIRDAIGAFLIQCPVYKLYGDSFPLEKHEAQKVQQIFRAAEERHPELHSAFSQLINALLVRPIDNDSEYNARASNFYKRCMQYTGPLMAKGVEDTFMYTYNRLLAHNDVGDSPLSFGIGKKEFHHKMEDRKASWPLTMNATATHDTKRGEDARVRLNVLSEMGDDWLDTLNKWKEINSLHKENGAPDANDELFIYQSLIACHPMPDDEDDSFTARFKAYIQKALREAKVNTDWAQPNEKYEMAVSLFVDHLLDKESEFYKSFYLCLQTIVDAGIIVSLSQLLLKATSPGVCDIYQGSELWNLSMVDPDNRRRINYEVRRQYQETPESENAASMDELWDTRYTGRLKLWLTRKLCNERAQYPDVFEHGNYIPLEVHGKEKKHIIAFARQYKHMWFVVVAPAHVYKLAQGQDKTIPDIDWGDTHIKLPAHLPGSFTNVLTNQKEETQEKTNLHEIFNNLPFAALRFETEPNKRGAGILLPVFSLPSKYGIGDCGPAAYRFAGFLHRSHQKYWQLLPLNPVDERDAWSPYSSVSGMAGNTLLISPDLLVDDGLLTTDEIKELETGNEKIDYPQVSKNKGILLEKAYNRFANGTTAKKTDFEKFCSEQNRWLHNYALFVALKQYFNGETWDKWPPEYKYKDRHTLEQFEQDHTQELDKIKWLQYVFFSQWQRLKAFCNSLGITLIGDLPFYSSYDSVAVWRHPDLFRLDENGNMAGISGVPPDYFSATGQLWNMPTYNWQKMAEDGYDWWINRLHHNLQLFDLVRIDHFRAFESYWEVPAGEKTAENGKWLKGPGMDFFGKLKEKLGSLPFIAEDLGYEMEEVYALREKTGLPGMKVLQYAWGANMPKSVDIPHNYAHNCIVYTGTHDNNTTIGWFKEETKKEDLKRIEEYTGVKPTKKNITRLMSRVAYASVANIVIIPMPDILELDETNRINTPGTDENNWQWRVPDDAITHKTEKHLREQVGLYNRY